MRKRISIDGFAKKVASLGGDLEKAVVRGLRSSALVLDGFLVHEIDAAAPFPAVDRGELRNSVVVRPTSRGGTAGVDAPHAPMINNGTRPFIPPLQPIYEWVLRKGFATDEADAMRVANAIRFHMGKVGIAPRHFFDKAWAKFRREKIVAREVGRELAALARSR